MPSSTFGTATPIRTKSVPELSNETALLTYLGLTPNELKKIWWFRERMYHRFTLAKDGKSKRVITAPDKRLKHLQRRIADLLDQLYRVRKPVHGFVEKRSVKTNAESHFRQRFIVNVDLLEFFPTITEKRVDGVLVSLGIDSRVASIIARLCCYAGHLPQGAPTSPVLSNMICFRLDRELLAFSKKARCIYTRYADDITFSSHQPTPALFDGPIPSSGHFSFDLLASTLRRIFVSNGFVLNQRKLHYADRNSRRTVTGLKINEIINVDRRYVRNIRAALYSVEKLGIPAAQEKFKKSHGGSSEIGNHLQGKLSWLRYIRGQSDSVFRAIAVRFNKCFPDLKVDIEPTAEEIRDRSVWVVEHFEGEMAQGSCFFLRGAGLITAAHCVEGATQVEIYHPSKPSNRFVGKVLQRNQVRDLAIIEQSIPITEFFELELSQDAAKVGDDLLAVGYPGFGPGDRLNERTGTISSLPIKHGVRFIEVTQKLSQGMSGGPLLDDKCRVVGVAHKGGPGEGRDFAVHWEELKAWLAEIYSD